MGTVIKNYRLDLSLGTTSISPKPKHNTTRLELIAPVVRQSVELAMQLNAKPNVTDLELIDANFWGAVLHGKRPDLDVRTLCFSHLYGTVTRYSNAVLSLIENSYGDVAFGLLRSVMEAHAKCHHISKHMQSRPEICRDYVVSCHLVDIYRGFVDGVKLRKRHNMSSMAETPKERHQKSSNGKEYYIPLLTYPLIEEMEERYKSFPHPLAWVRPDLKSQTSIASLIEGVDKKYAKLYHMCNPEVHGAYSGIPRYAVVHSDTPLRFIPFRGWGKGTFFEDFKEAEFDYIVTDILVSATHLLPMFVPTNKFNHKVDTIVERGKRVLDNLLGRSNACES
ncbi:MAG: hypothetical protein F4X05_07430 [Rhodothermaceae bacterium]|nr:hypothetical protein [Rhodothermaceae bacterium]MYD19464.1 hypothetical protein [Rhodothermaceae bacterium]MYJ56824.1 hypothetical protein [Rhodothermaceae bacterium]